MTFIAGAYQATYKGAALGLIEDGFTIEWTSRVEDILTDIGGDVPIDGVYRGVECTVSFVLSEWDAVGAQGAFWPWSTTLGQAGDLGRLISTMSGALLLQKCGLTGNQVPASITFDNAILNPGFSVSTLWANKHRKIPLQMKALPNVVGSSSGAFTSCAAYELFRVV